MKKQWYLFSFMVVIALAVAACGPKTETTADKTSTTGKAPAIAGTYSGAYTTNIITSTTPYTLTITQDGYNLGGQFTSLKISGPVTGTVAADKTMSLTITEARSLGTIKVTLSSVGSGFAVTSVSGTDVFGIHTSGSGTGVTSTSPVSLLANGYNGIGTFVNNGALPIASGIYPISVTNLLPDGSGNYSGVVTNKFVSGMLSIQYYSEYSLYSGIIYTGFGTSTWALKNGGFTSSDIANNLSLTILDDLAFPSVFAYVMTLHPGDFTKVFPGTWNYNNPDQTATGILSLQLVVTSPDGVNYSVNAAANVRQVAGGPVDTVSGTLGGAYNLNPVTNPRAASGRVFQVALAPSGSLTLKDNSGSTTGLSVYIDWLDNSTAKPTALISVDTGSKTWADITLEK